MRKSKSIRLVLLGSAGLALGACDEAPPPDARFFADVGECAATYDEARCNEAFAKSRQAFTDEAPRYTRKEECETEFGVGNCETETTSGGGSFFLPMMMGYMMGNAFNQPVYRGPDGRALMRSGGKSYSVGSFTGAGRTASFRQAPITPIQRGGFGSTATAYNASSGG